MKRITVVLPDEYDDAVTITAVGQTMGVAHVRTNVSVQTADLTGHDGETLVIRPHERSEWRKPETDWIPVTERLPEKGQVVLAFGKRHATSGQFSGTVSDPSVWYWKGSVKTVTHWMPLPEPPEEV